MSNVDKLNLIQAGEPLNGTGREAYGEEDVLNRPLRELIQLMEQGQIDVYGTKIAYPVTDNNDFSTNVQNEDLVSYNQSTNLYDLAVDGQTAAIGFADLTNSVVHVIGLKEFTGYTFTKGKYYYLDKNNPGKIVDEDSANKSMLVVGIAISTAELFVKLQYDMDMVADSSIAYSIVFGS